MDRSHPDEGYQPTPIDTSTVVLPDDLLALVERLAENAHDTWAITRLASGWTWGPGRDNAERRNPSLIPYGLLDESEKQVDRDMVLGTVRAILALGFEIRRPTR